MTSAAFDSVCSDFPNYYDAILSKAMERLEKTLRSNASLEARSSPHPTAPPSHYRTLITLGTPPRPPHPPHPSRPHHPHHPPHPSARAQVRMRQLGLRKELLGQRSAKMGSAGKWESTCEKEAGGTTAAATSSARWSVLRQAVVGVPAEPKVEAAADAKAPSRRERKGSKEASRKCGSRPI